MVENLRSVAAAVRPTHGEGCAGAPRRLLSSAERREIDRAADVPRIGHDEATGPAMQGDERHALFFDCRGHDCGAPFIEDRETIWPPATSKFAGASHRSKAARRAGHS